MPGLETEGTLKLPRNFTAVVFALLPGTLLER